MRAVIEHKERKVAPGSRNIENRTETLLRGIQSSGLCVIYHDAELSVRLVENLPTSWPTADRIFAAGDVAIFDPFTAERVLAAKRDVLARGVPQRIEAPLRRDGAELLWFELNIEQDRDGAGEVRGLFVSVTDITQIKRREATLRDLLYEVSHRSRNMLAILQSVLGQTAINATSVAEFEDKFRGRIASLAQSQDLITYANWQSVRFRRLVEAQVAPYVEESDLEPVVEGADPQLSPNTTLHLGLALHELAANSHAFGVLGSGDGTIKIVVSPINRGFRFEWIETPEHPVFGEVDIWGFGRTVLHNVVPRALQSEAVYSVRPTGVHYILDLPYRHADDTPPTPDDQASRGVNAVR